jgi:hypothetical protein
MFPRSLAPFDAYWLFTVRFAIVVLHPAAKVAVNQFSFHLATFAGSVGIILLNTTWLERQ